MIIIVPNYKVRKAKLKDLPELFNLWRKLVDYHKKKAPKQFKLKKSFIKLSNDYLKKQIYNRNAQIFVVESENKLVGYGLFAIMKFPTIYVIDKEVKINDLFVEEKFRKKGIGQKLIAAGRAWAKKKGIKHMNLNVHTWNKSAIKSYKRAGFKEKRFIMKDY